MTAPAASIGIGELVDLARYPLDSPGSDAWHAVVATARDELRDDGCAVIRDLVRPGAVRRLDDEIVARKHTTHYSTQVINPYFHTSGDPARPERHPINTFIERSSGFIPGDSWEPDCATAVLFRSRELAAFLAACLEVPALHCYDDPLAGLTANVLDPGQQFTWHFDTNEFAVTVLVREAGAGGLFEYVPGIRSSTDEGFDAIQAILEGGRDGVRTLDLRPGDLQIFRGRHSLHRVTRVPVGASPRHAAIFAYTLEPGVIGRVERTEQLFGRVLPEHIAAEQARVRSDTLTD
ncbi:MAG: arpA protein [Ilumatobacter sp.]|nr:arpA protein [Ilumatobacter sp.]